MAKILVVDDNEGNREYLVTLLGYAGHRVLEASDGVEALLMARGAAPDLVITDIIMPTIDGFEFVKRLRSDPDVAGTPVVFCTGTYREREARLLAKPCGVRHILTKPVEPRDVLKVVNEALGHPETQIFPAAAQEIGAEDLGMITDAFRESIEERESVTARLGGWSSSDSTWSRNMTSPPWSENSAARPTISWPAATPSSGSSTTKGRRSTNAALMVSLRRVPRPSAKNRSPQQFSRPRRRARARFTSPI